MKEKLTEIVPIKRWVVILLLPIFLTVLGVGMNIALAAGETKTRISNNTEKIEINKQDIDILEVEKADVHDVQRIHVVMDQMNKKLDLIIMGD
jgi:hypothetical protein